MLGRVQNAHSTTDASQRANQPRCIRSMCKCMWKSSCGAYPILRCVNRMCSVQYVIGCVGSVLEYESGYVVQCDEREMSSMEMPGKMNRKMIRKVFLVTHVMTHNGIVRGARTIGRLLLFSTALVSPKAPHTHIRAKNIGSLGKLL